MSDRRAVYLQGGCHTATLIWEMTLCFPEKSKPGGGWGQHWDIYSNWKWSTNSSGCESHKKCVVDKTQVQKKCYF